MSNKDRLIEYLIEDIESYEAIVREKDELIVRLANATEDHLDVIAEQRSVIGELEGIAAESWEGWRDTSVAGIELLKVIDELAESNPFGFAIVYPDWGSVEVLREVIYGPQQKSDADLLSELLATLGVFDGSDVIVLPDAQLPPVDYPDDFGYDSEDFVTELGNVESSDGEFVPCAWFPNVSPGELFAGTSLAIDAADADLFADDIEFDCGI